MRLVVGERPMGMDLTKKNTDENESELLVASTKKKAKAPKAADSTAMCASPLYIFELLHKLKMELNVLQAGKPCMELYDAQVHVDQLHRALVAAKL